MEREAEADAKSEAESKRAGMEICLSHDRQAGRALQKEAKAADKEAGAAAERAEAAEKKITAVKERLAAKAPGGDGPFMKAFKLLLKEVKIDIKKYFGGTYIGPDINKVSSASEAARVAAELLARGVASRAQILSSRANIAKLAALLRRRSVACPDGIERMFGDDARAAAVGRGGDDARRARDGPVADPLPEGVLPAEEGDMTTRGGQMRALRLRTVRPSVRVSYVSLDRRRRLRASRVGPPRVMERCWSWCLLS